jgi:acetyl-CoA carboxylase carboxyltransferase component
MGPGGGVEFMYKNEMREALSDFQRDVREGVPDAVAARKRDERLLQLRERYERELMNPKEALSLGSVSRIVMPGTSRRVLAENLDFLMRTYQPAPMAGPQREFE